VTLSEWLARLELVSPGEIVMGLERMHEVLGRLDPWRPPTVFHVGGTNGKGSSVAMLSTLLSASGCRTGAYTSPHLVRYNERIAVDGQPVSDGEIIQAFEQIEAAREDVPLTYFEFGTLAALLVFRARDVDVAVFEVGLGGRLDAVNAIDPDAALITSIALDHQAWLGDTREAIAREKAGIMRSGRPVVFADEDRPRNIDDCARETGAELLASGRDFTYEEAAESWTWKGVRRQLVDLEKPALAGAVQLSNAAGVLALMEAGGFEDVLESNGVSKGLAAVELGGRMQTYVDGHRWRFDVAHNPAAAAALASMLRQQAPARRIAVVGILDDKDVAGIVTALAPEIDDWIAVAAESARAIPAPELARRIAGSLNRHCQIAESVDQALDAARELAGASGEILVVGSFATVGPVQAALGL
jgi:dihydrofolate synthase/folylpolyglutamate synthase